MSNTPNNIPGICNISHIFPPYREYQWFEGLNSTPKLTIDLQSQQFSTVNAWFFSELCALIYDNEDFNRKILCEKLHIANSDIQWFHHQGNEAMLINYQHAQIVVFQGTHFPRLSFINFSSVIRTAENILLDDLVIEHSEQTVANGRQSAQVNLHKGFVKALGNEKDENSLWGQIVKHLDNNKPLWLTGHSLGGAMANIAAMQMPQNVAGLYTYGAPCVGDEKAKQWQQTQLKDKFYRYVNGTDIVCNIMTTTKFRRHFDYYNHAGELKTINVQGDLGPFNFIERLMDKTDLSFIDHSPVYYMIGCYTNSHIKPNTQCKTKTL